MLEIKTIIETIGEALIFDREVNEALTEGWGLVRRDFILYSNPIGCGVYLYAELEREIETEEEEDDAEDDGSAEWVLSRNPAKPYRCSACGFEAPADWFAFNGRSSKYPAECPNCERRMRGME